MEERPTAAPATTAMADQQHSSVQATPDVLSPELIKAVADRVYALWLTELRIARQRTGFRTQMCYHRPGGGLWR
jgi:hypothetical protein